MPGTRGYAATACVYTLLKAGAGWLNDALARAPLTAPGRAPLEDWILADDERPGALAQIVLEMGHAATIFEAVRQTPSAAGAMYAVVL